MLDSIEISLVVFFYTIHSYEYINITITFYCFRALLIIFHSHFYYIYLRIYIYYITHEYFTPLNTHYRLQAEKQGWPPAYQSAAAVISAPYREAISTFLFFAFPRAQISNNKNSWLPLRAVSKFEMVRSRTWGEPRTIPNVPVRAHRVDVGRQKFTCRRFCLLPKRSAVVLFCSRSTNICRWRDFPL